NTAVLGQRPDGSFVASYQSGSEVGVREISATGELGGTLVLPAAPDRPFSFDDVEMTDDSSFVVAGPDGFGTPEDEVLVGVGPDLTLDPGFGTGGVAHVPDLVATGVVGIKVLTTDDGDLLVVGPRPKTPTLPTPGIVTARLTADGTLDPTYG